MHHEEDEMPGSFLNIDTNFPTFTGRESNEEQIYKMLNYMRQLVDQLRYTLNNLDQSNFNRTALDKIIDEGTGSLAEKVETIAQQLNQTNERVSNLSDRLGNCEGNVTTLQGTMTTVQGDVTTLQGDVTNLQGDVTTVQGDVTDLQGDVTALQGDVTTVQGDMTTVQGDVTDLQGDLTRLQTAVQVDENTGDVSIGGTGVRVDLDGAVYINGQLQ